MNLASRPTPLFIGVDGGGTGCRARIEDASGSLLGTGIAGPAAIRIGIDDGWVLPEIGKIVDSIAPESADSRRPGGVAGADG